MADKKYFMPQDTAHTLQDFYGGKNLVALAGEYGTISGVNYTYDTFNGTITVNGTATSTSGPSITPSFLLRKGNTYKLSGCPTGGGEGKFILGLITVSNSGETSRITTDNGNGARYIPDRDVIVHLAIAVYSGYTCSNLVFKPMIRLNEVTSDEFVTYSPSIHDIVNKLPNIPSSINGTGRNLTAMLSSTPSIYDYIYLGDFSNIKPGDYIIGPVTGMKYWIAHRDPFYGYGTIGFQSTHHVMLWPASNLGTGPMNDTNTTAGGYYNSKGKATVDQLIQDFYVKDFGTHIKKFKNLLSNAVTDGVPSGYEWYDSYGDLPNDINIYGSHSIICNWLNVGTQKEQFEIFRDLGTHIAGASSLVLKDIVSSKDFSVYRYDGIVSKFPANIDFAFRPFAILAA